MQDMANTKCSFTQCYAVLCIHTDVVHLIQSRERDANACACVYPISPENAFMPPSTVPSPSVRLLWIFSMSLCIFIVGVVANVAAAAAAVATTAVAAATVAAFVLILLLMLLLLALSLLLFLIFPISVTLQCFFFSRCSHCLSLLLMHTVCIEISCSPDENFQ